jgi:hypothetical protein
MRGKRARQLRRLAARENREKDEVQEIVVKKKFVDKNKNVIIREFKTLRYLGSIRLYRGLKKWRQTKKGTTFQGHS